MKRRCAVLLAVLALAACSGPEVLNSMTRDIANEVWSGIVYDTYDPQAKLRLDVYAHHGTQNAPVIVFFYGKRWSGGHRDEYAFVGQALASEGFVVVIPDYRKYPQVRFPAFMQDAAKAVKWAHDNAARYGGAPDKLFVMGHSTGAHMAALLALDNEFLQAVGLDQQGLRGMIGLAGPYDFLPITDPELRDLFGPPERFERSQPVFYVDGRNPPLLLVHGEDDRDIPVRNTRSLAKRVVDNGGAVETLIYDHLSQSCAVAAITDASSLSCGDPQPNLRTEIAKFVRAHSR